MNKAPQVNIEEVLCEYLQKNYRGANNPVSSKQLEAVFHVKGTEIRRLVNSLRSNMEGYYYAANQHEINATIAQLSSRINKIAKARDGLVNRNPDPE